MSTNSSKITINLITGFLGSGKTTLINHVLNSNILEKTLVLVNEFGQVSIDDALIKKSTDTVVELKNGCVCCSLNEDLASTLQDFVGQRATGRLPKFNMLILETTGLANAGPILEIILNDPIVKKHYELGKVITTVDGVHGVTNLDIHAESVEQVAVSDQLIITKTDKIEEKVINELVIRLIKLNPSAEILYSKFGEVDVKSLLSKRSNIDLLTNLDPKKWHANQNSTNFMSESSNSTQISNNFNENKSDGIHKHRHDNHIHTFCLTTDKPISTISLTRFQNKLMEMAGPNLLRIKGLINLKESLNKPVLFQGVQEEIQDWEFLDKWPNSDRSTRIVLIGWLLDEESIRNLFFECIGKEAVGF